MEKTLFVCCCCCCIRQWMFILLSFSYTKTKYTCQIDVLGAWCSMFVYSNSDVTNQSIVVHEQTKLHHKIRCTLLGCPPRKMKKKALHKAGDQMLCAHHQRIINTKYIHTYIHVHIAYTNSFWLEKVHAHRKTGHPPPSMERTSSRHYDGKQTFIKRKHFIVEQYLSSQSHHQSQIVRLVYQINIYENIRQVLPLAAWTLVFHIAVLRTRVVFLFLYESLLLKYVSFFERKKISD